MPSRKPLVAILAGFILLGCLYNLLIPPFEGADGPQHYAYLEWLAQGKGFPPQGKAAWETPVRQEASQPPLYYLLAVPAARLVGTSDPAAVFRPNPHFPSPAPGNVPDNKNVAVHYPADTHPWPRGGWLALTLARGVSLLCGAVLVIAVYGLASQVAPAQPQVAVGAALLTAVTPQVLFQSSVISNDIAAAATGALALWQLAALLRRGPSFLRGLSLGALFGLATLCKVNALVLGLPLSAGLIWLWLARPLGRGATFKAALGVAAGGLLVAGPWYLRSWVLYGHPLGLETHYQAPWALGGESSPAGPAARWLEVFYSLWAAFGWGNIKFTAGVYAPLLALTAVALAGLLLAVVRWWRSGGHFGPKAATVAALGLAAVALLAALAHWMQQVTAPHGRLLFPALAAMILLLVLGWRAIHRWLPWLAVSYVGALALLAPVLLIHPAYVRPPAVEEIVSPPLGWRFGDEAELLRVEPESASAAAGDTLPIEVCWRPLRRTDRDLSIMVHLVGPQERVVTERYTYPGLGSYPTTTWEPGVPFCDRIRVEIPADLFPTLLYRIEIGLLDWETLERLPAYDAGGQTLSHTFVAVVRLSAAGSPTAMEPPAGANAIRLLDYELSTAWHAGEDHEIQLRWWTAEPVIEDYTLFVHLRDTMENQIVAQADGPPLDGWYPTSWWETGEVITDTRHFPLPAETPPGSYELVVGWYLPASGTRMADEYRLGAIEVQQ